MGPRPRLPWEGLGPKPPMRAPFLPYKGGVPAHLAGLRDEEIRISYQLPRPDSDDEAIVGNTYGR